MSFSDTINATTINASKFYKNGEELNHSHIESGDITASQITLNDGANDTIITPFTTTDGNEYGIKINPLYDNENGVSIVNNIPKNSVNVGIGTTNPSKKLHVEAKNETGAILEISRTGTHTASLYFGGNNGWGNITSNKNLSLKAGDTTGNGNAQSAQLLLHTNGNVGIGISEPKYPLDIDLGSSGIPSGDGYIYYYEGTFGKKDQEDNNKKIAVRCSERYYLGAGYVAYSDSRIKENIQDVPDDLSLQTLRAISCNYYEYKDKKSRGIEKTIGFIAQQVKEKMPMAVTLQRDWIPNEMRIIENPTWEELPDNKFKLTIPDLEDVSGNTKYKFYVSNDVSGNDEIMKESKTLENDTKSFVFNRSWNNVFLYGKEVNDFHTLDKQKLFTLNFSATQEIDKIQQKHKVEIAQLNNKVISLQNQLESALKRLDNLESN